MLVLTNTVLQLTVLVEIVIQEQKMKDCRRRLR